MIWTTVLNLTDINLRGKNTLVETLNIEFTEIGNDFLTARMPVDHRTKQWLGIMHGGASCVLAETAGSTAANYAVDLTQYYCVGLDINTNHIRSVSNGFVHAKASPFHLGKSTQVWHIEIRNDQQALVSINRLTMSVMSRR